MRRFSTACLCLLTALVLLLTLSAGALAAPVEDGRDLSPLPDDWFDDAVIFGDSITVTLKKYCAKTGDLGDVLFLCEFSYGIRNAVSGNLKVWYQGQEYLPWDVLPLTGANKVFVMLGVNDIALYGGIDRTMEKWEEFVTGIRATCPDIRFYIESCLPIWHTIHYEGLDNDFVDTYNGRLKAFCEEQGCVYVDICAPFKDEYNGLKAEYCSDEYVHITYPAAELWVQQLKDPANYSVDPRST